MHEINIAAIETDDPDFPIARDAALDRYTRLYEEHGPDGRIIRRRSAEQRELVASAYTAIILSHTQTVAGAFNSGLYASGFALLRPTLEALLKQHMLGDYAGSGDGWKSIPDRKIRVTIAGLTDVAARSGCTVIVPLWKDLAPGLNDFVHGGRGQLTSNPINDIGWPQYPGAWFWSAAQTITMSALGTSAWFWAHVGYEERCQAILDTVTNEDWDSLMIVRNGLSVKIVARRG